MASWIVLLLVLINAGSLLVFYLIDRNISHLEQSHIRILGSEHKAMVSTKRLKTLRISYLVLVLLLAVYSFYLFSGH
ncbi:MAG: hypothetical protein Q8P95_03790 [bacterium]|nr:hypothetical protein [bacterium]